MSLRYLIHYMVVDYLLDQKAKCEKLGREANSSSSLKTELAEQRSYEYNQGLQALRRHKDFVPECVQKYYLGLAPRPTVQDILRGFQELPRRQEQKMIWRFAKILFYLALVALTILAIFLD